MCVCMCTLYVQVHTVFVACVWLWVCTLCVRVRPLWNSVDREQQEEAEACSLGPQVQQRRKKINIQGEIIKSTYRRAKWQWAASSVVSSRFIMPGPPSDIWDSDIVFIQLAKSGCCSNTECVVWCPLEWHTYSTFISAYTHTDFASSSIRHKLFFYPSMIRSLLLLRELAAVVFVSFNPIGCSKA